MALLVAMPIGAADRPQWGERHSRNMVSPETGLPESFDPVSGTHVKWKVALGSENYGTPVIAGGKVLVGANNNPPRDKRLTGDRACIICLDEQDGNYRWQLALQRRGPTVYWDWMRCGMCSSPSIEGKYAYLVTNRSEVVCVDLAGMADGNEGPFRDEAQLFALRAGPPMEPGAHDADVVWICDLVKEMGVRPHDAAICSVLIDGPVVYVNTSNGLNDQHSAMGNPEAPSLVALDKATGRIIAREREKIGDRTFHCTWSSPALGEADGRRMVVFGGGDGICYGFKPMTLTAGDEAPAALECLWRFDCDPTAPKEIRAIARNRREGPSSITGMPVFFDGRVYVAAGGDTWWGKRQAALICFEPVGDGDITTKRIWSYPFNSHCMSAPAVHDGLAYIGDVGGTIHCIDARSGAAVWTHAAGGDIWASPLVADGKLYLGTRRGILWVLATGREKKVLSRVELQETIDASVTAANGVLYVTTMKTLYAVAAGGR